MTELKKARKRVLPPASAFRQFSMTFESTGLLGLTSVERMKVVSRLSRLLMLAAGASAEERDDESQARHLPIAASNRSWARA